MPFKVKPPLWNTWWSMRQRCENPNYHPFKDYGGRGITICDAWMSYKQFEKDMGPKPSPLHTIDRIDNNKSYSPENCRWATRKEQQHNQTVTRRVTIEGKEYVAVELAEKAGVKTDTIMYRAANGLPLAKVLSSYRAGKSSRYEGTTHCKRGHEFTPGNTCLSREGWRRCRACHRAKMRRINAAKRNRGKGITPVV
jgi:hypothetical protein